MRGETGPDSGVRTQRRTLERRTLGPNTLTTMPYNVHHSLVTLLSYGSLYSGAQICMLVTTAPFSMLL